MTFIKPKRNPDRKGGNCDIYFDGEYAYKFLRNNSSKAKIQRFLREAQFCKQLVGNKDLHIAEIIDVNIEDDNTKCYIQMKKYVGTLIDILPNTQGNPQKNCSYLLPIVKTLSELSSYSSPIYHRDIKPDNILFDGKELFIGDFGICYINDSNDNRFTMTSEAMGARLFMAPEYEVGRVEEINEKGDIFSIGKLLWYMANGEINSYLPYDLWYIDSYNLIKKYDTYDMCKLVLIISKCLEIDPSKRCTYDELINDMEDMISSDAKEEIKANVELKARISLENKAVDVIKNRNEMLLKMSNSIIKEAITQVYNQYMDCELIKDLYGFIKHPLNYEHLAMQANGSYFTASYMQYTVRFNCLSKHDKREVINIEIELAEKGYPIQKYIIIHDSNGIKYNKNLYNTDQEKINSICGFFETVLKICYKM